MSDYKRLSGSTEVERYNNLGVEKCENKELDLGIANFNRAIRLNPNISVLYFNRAIAFIELGFNFSSVVDFEHTETLILVECL